MFKYLSLIILFLISSCASAPKQEDIKVFQNGLSYLEEGNKEMALSSFEQACQKNVLAACLYVGKELSPDESLTYSVMQGMTTDSTTVINVSIPTDMLPEVKFFDVTQGKFLGKKQIIKSIHRFKDEAGSVLQFDLSGLSTKSEYRVELYSSPGKIEDYRLFKTLGSKEELKIGIASCMSDEFMEVQEQMWSQFIALKPDVAFLIGDNVYADVINGKYIGGEANPQQIWMRHLETRENLKFYHTRRLIPTFGTWDDHDYGFNNGDKTYKYKKESAQIFSIFFPYAKAKSTSKGPGLSYRFSLSGQNFYFLDARSFRDHYKNEKGTHLGVNQEKWLFKDMRSVRGPNWLVKGDQFFGKYHRYESWERYHPQNLKSFLSKVRRERDPALFVSGDRHLTEIMKLEKKLVGYPSFELTSSAIHSKVYPGSFAKEPNPRQLVGTDGEYNFMFIKARAKGRQLVLGVTSFGLQDKVQYSRRLELKK
jgi:alkaline phosphatase D